LRAVKIRVLVRGGALEVKDMVLLDTEAKAELLSEPSSFKLNCESKGNGKPRE